MTTTYLLAFCDDVVAALFSEHERAFNPEVPADARRRVVTHVDRYEGRHSWSIRRMRLALASSNAYSSTRFALYESEAGSAEEALAELLAKVRRNAT